MLEYDNNHRRNLKLYWRQFYPNWEIPKGYHVHHIKPKCTFENKADPRIHHPRNLIALHPDDHATIHKCRGDKIHANSIFSMIGRVVSDETKMKMSKAQQGKVMSPEARKRISEARKGRTSPFNGKTMSEEAKQKISKAHTGRIVTEETRQRLSIAATKQWIRQHAAGEE